MPSDATLKALNAFHRGLIRLTGGRLGWRAAEMPVLELTTTGRRTGRPHTVLLTSPVQEGPAFVLVASRGGDDRPPAWLLNLQADARVRVRINGEPRAMVARVASGEERARLWPQVVAKFRSYAGYQEKTTREIALVLLEPDAP